MKSASVYILLFRGVGGATQLPVGRLRAELTDVGFEHVVTYINSGNAVVRSPWPRRRVVETTAEVCRRAFGFDKAIFAITPGEWAALIANNPFPAAASDGKTLHAAVLADRPAAADVEAVRAYAEGDEGFAVVGKVAYLHTPSGFGTSKLAAQFDRRIGVVNTARNWNTVRKLAEIARAVAAGRARGPERQGQPADDASTSSR
jgi:uncharacterized protein (DUF1697 family)